MSHVVIVDTQARRVLVRCGTRALFDYVAPCDGTPPHLRCLAGPSERNLLDACPADHAHHRGVWWGHGDVNGEDFYLDRPGEPEIRHVALERVEQTSRGVRIAHHLDWVSSRGTLLRERRELAFELRPDGEAIVDCDVSLRARADVVLGETKELALPGLRPAEALTVFGGGELTADGGRIGECQVLAALCEWVDCCGDRRAPRGGAQVTEGITCITHPDDGPARLFARDYGPVCPRSPPLDRPPVFLAAGDSLRLRHRLLAHAGAADLAAVDAERARYGFTR